MTISPVMEAVASNQFYAEVEDVAGELIFPGDSIYGVEPIYLGPDGTVQEITDGSWTNRTEQAFEIGNLDGEEEGLWLQPMGYVLTVKGGTSRLADDDGFVGSPKSIMRQCGATQDDLKILLAKRFVLGFESGVIVIKHWRINNYLQASRHRPTTYQEELATLMLDEKGAYTECLTNAEQLLNNCSTSVQQMLAENSIDKNRLDKTSIEEDSKAPRKRFAPPTVDEVQAYCIERKNSVDPQRFVDYYSSNGWKVGKNAMKDWKAAVRTWERSGYDSPKKQEKRPYGANNGPRDDSKAMEQIRRLREKMNSA